MKFSLYVSNEDKGSVIYSYGKVAVLSPDRRSMFSSALPKPSVKTLAASSALTKMISLEPCSYSLPAQLMLT